MKKRIRRLKNMHSPTLAIVEQGLIDRKCADIRRKEMRDQDPQPRLPNHEEAATMFGREEHRIKQYIEDGLLTGYLVVNKKGIETWRIYPESIACVKAGLSQALALTVKARNLEGYKRRNGNLMNPSLATPEFRCE